MKAERYTVVTNGEEFRLVDSNGDFLMEKTETTPFLVCYDFVSFKTKEEAEQRAKSLSWVLC